MRRRDMYLSLNPRKKLSHFRFLYFFHFFIGYIFSPTNLTSFEFETIEIDAIDDVYACDCYDMFAHQKIVRKCYEVELVCIFVSSDYKNN